LDAAWLAFHDNKYIFEDLEIREHFNISKIHKLKHYVDSIRSRGTTDGFNSEGTERLHIDLAKVAYNASNKRAYTRQMTVWLRRQEAVHKFGTYLQWAVPGYTAPTNSGGDIDAVEEEDDEHEPEPTTPDSDTEDSDDEGEVEELSPAFTVAKTPGFPTVTVAAIQADFHAPDFIRNLGRFLQTKGITPRLQPVSIPHSPFTNDSPLLSHKFRRLDQPTERSRITPKGIIPAKPGQFDTVLVRVQPRGVNETPTDGLCVARVRVIFRIPDDFGQYPDPVAVSAFGLILGITMDTCSLAGKPAKMKESSMIVDSGGYVLPCRFFGASRTGPSGAHYDASSCAPIVPMVRLSGAHEGGK
ncbi:hypothetical protein C8F04DRAFT_1193855, partial [Mycena alexandri]